MQAAKMILDRFLPARKDRTIKIDLPQIHTGEDILKAVGAIVEGVLSESMRDRRLYFAVI
jgi:hypothetical protein